MLRKDIERLIDENTLDVSKDVSLQLSFGIWCYKAGAKKMGQSFLMDAAKSFDQFQVVLLSLRDEYLTKMIGDKGGVDKDIVDKCVLDVIANKVDDDDIEDKFGKGALLYLGDVKILNEIIADERYLRASLEASAQEKVIPSSKPQLVH